MALSLDDIVRVDVTVSAMSVSAGTFNIGMIVGKSKIIPLADRVKVYSSLAAMKADKWKETDPEYAAAAIYFSQDPVPSKVVIGRWSDSTTDPETADTAIAACRAANDEWYACYVVNATAADIEAVAGTVEALKPKSTYFYTTNDEAVKAGIAGNIMETLKNKGYKRTFGQYSTTPHAAVASMGYAMGANNGLANSAFTLAYKKQVGVSPESLSEPEAENILKQNGNVYTKYGSKYNLLVQGTMADGTHFDEVLNLDMLTAEIQIGATNALVASRKIPQTEVGNALLLSAIEDQCEKSVLRGAIAPGVWKEAPILSLQTGDMLSKGYLVLSGSIADQTQEDRDARKSPPIYVPVKLAGAIEHAVIGVYVNR